MVKKTISTIAQLYEKTIALCILKAAIVKSKMQVIQQRLNDWDVPPGGWVGLELNCNRFRGLGLISINSLVSPIPIICAGSQISGPSIVVDLTVNACIIEGDSNVHPRAWLRMSQQDIIIVFVFPLADLKKVKEWCSPPEGGDSPISLGVMYGTTIPSFRLNAGPPCRPMLATGAAVMALDSFPPVAANWLAFMITSSGEIQDPIYKNLYGDRNGARHIWSGVAFG